MKTSHLRSILPGMLLLAVIGPLAHADRPKLILGLDGDLPAPERRIAIQAKPNWIERGGEKWLILPRDGGDPLEVASPVTTLPDKELRFRVWVSERVMWREDDGTAHTTTFAELEAVSDEMQMYYDATICPLHQLRMTRAEIEIHYGRLALKPEEWKIYSGGPGWVAGGCIVWEHSPRTKWGYRCDRCVAIYTKASEEQIREMERRRAIEVQAAKGLESLGEK